MQEGCRKFSARNRTWKTQSRLGFPALTEDGLYSSLDVDLEEPADGEYFTFGMEGYDPDGAFYNVINCSKFEGIIRLCNVTHEFFGDHPDRIYCRVISYGDMRNAC